MGRLVEAGRRERVVGRDGGLEAVGGGEVTVGGDNYLDRLAKYIPGEIVTAYTYLDRNLVPNPHELVGTFAGKSVNDHLLSSAGIKPWLPLVLCLVFTPLYLRQMASRAGPQATWWTQSVISMIALLFWAYAMQGSPFVIGIGGHTWYDGQWAAFLLGGFTLIAPIFGPTPKTQGDYGTRTHT